MVAESRDEEVDTTRRNRRLSSNEECIVVVVALAIESCKNARDTHIHNHLLQIEAPHYC
jgi:hypothetical protein